MTDIIASGLPPFIIELEASGAPASGSRVTGLNRWWPGTYLLYHRGIEYFRPTEAPEWLESAVIHSHLRVGGLPAYRDEATDEVVPVLGVGMGPVL